MNKEEFLNIINITIEKRRNELRELKDYFDIPQDEFDERLYKLNLVNEYVRRMTEFCFDKIIKET